MKKLLFCLLVIVCGLTLQSCPGDEPTNIYDNNTNKEIKPSIEDIMSTTTLSDFTVTFRVKSVEMPATILKYSRETSSTSSPSLDKTSKPTFIKKVEMKSSGYSYYYFKSSHTGFNGGNRIYFQIQTSNSKGSDESNVRVCIIKR